jgi:hypothetical protein
MKGPNKDYKETMQEMLLEKFKEQSINDKIKQVSGYNLEYDGYIS